MARENFPAALKCVLVHEGGYVNHPADPGGETNKGVTRRVYDGYRAMKGLPKRSVRFIEANELLEIYQRQYWNKIRGDELPAGVDFVVFDGAVNSGPSQSVKWLQAALGVVVDGNLGEATLSAAIEHPNHDEVVADILSRRLAFLKRLKTYGTFGNGWNARVAGVLKTGQAMATGTMAPKIVFLAGMDQRAEVSDLRQPSGAVTAAADASIAGGSATTAISGSISGAVQQIEPLKDASPILMDLFIGLTLAGIIIATVGIALRWYRNRQAAAAVAVQSAEAVAALDELDGLLPAESA